MSNIDDFIHNSTKKILSLVRSLPTDGSGADRGRLEEALRRLKKPVIQQQQDANSHQQRRRFKRHTQKRPDSDLDADLLSENECVMLKNPRNNKGENNDLTESSPTSSCSSCSSPSLGATRRAKTVAKRKGKEKRLMEQMGHGDRYTCTKNEFDKNKNKVKEDARKTSKMSDKETEINGLKHKNEKVEAKEQVKQQNGIVKKTIRSKSAVSVGENGKETQNDDANNMAATPRKSPRKICLDPKMKLLVEKGTKTLKKIRLIFDSGIEPPDGAEDLMRRKKRTAEFAARFSRNYLYQLNRIITDIESILKSNLNGHHISNNNAQQQQQRLDSTNIMLNHKIFSAFHTISLGLDAYKKHLPTAIVSELPEKFREFLVASANVCELFKTLSCCSNEGDESKESIVDVFQIYCNGLLMDEDFMKPNANCGSLMSLNNINNSQKQMKALNGVNSRRTEKKSSRFAMYHAALTNTRESGWKRAVANLAKKKFNVASKYKTATFKHRPHTMPSAPPQGQQQPQSLALTMTTKNLKVGRHKGNANSNKTATVTHSNVIDMDKNVTTVVQEHESKLKLTASNEAVPSCASKQATANGRVTLSSKSGNLWKYANGLYQKISKSEVEMGPNEYECILQQFLTAVTGKSSNNNSASVEDEKPPSASNAQTILERKFGKSIEEMDFQEFFAKLVECARSNDTHLKNSVDGPRKDGEKPVHVSKSGTNNAQLICIKDDTSLVLDAFDHNHHQHHRQHHEPQQSADKDEFIAKADRQNGADCNQDGVEGKHNNIMKENVSHIMKRKTEGHENVCPTNQSLLIYKEREEADANCPKGCLHQHHQNATRRLVGGNKYGGGSSQPLFHLRLLPKKTMLDIIDYKLQYHKEMKKNKMYKKTANIVPWLLVERIADTLLEENLNAITRDIQVDQILQRIYTQEFK